MLLESLVHIIILTQQTQSGKFSADLFDFKQYIHLQHSTLTGHEAATYINT